MMSTVYHKNVVCQIIVLFLMIFFYFYRYFRYRLHIVKLLFMPNILYKMLIFYGVMRQLYWYLYYFDFIMRMYFILSK